MTRYAEVVVTLPVEGRFHYAIPAHLEGALEIGHRVLVPFGRRRVTGFVLALAAELPATLEGGKVRAILERLDAEPLLPRDVLALAAFAAEYYLATSGEVLKIALPPGITAASKARWVITAQGRHWMDLDTDRLPNGARLTTDERRLLEAAVKGAGAKLGDAPPKAAAALEALGFITRKDTIAAKEAKGGEAEIVERTPRGRAEAPEEAPPPAASDVRGSGAPQPIARELDTSASSAPEASQLVLGELGLGEAPAVDPAERARELRAIRARVLRKPTRLDVYLRLAEGPRGVDELAEEVGRRKLMEALRDLEAAELVVRRRVATSAAGVRPAKATSFTGEPEPALTPEQARALEAIVARMDAGGAFLLHGVTGSGKTEVYLRTIAEARAKGHGAIVLVPEIALTPQLEARFRARFGDGVAVLHSALTDAERRKRWQALRRGEAHIALGPRSAIWAPVHDARVIVVDEEHDPSFKQGSDVRYNGRDLALTRAHHAHGLALLGSATPSLESLHLVETGRLIELRLEQRVGGRPMPAVELVDLGRERDETRGEPRVLTRALADRLRAVVKKGEQAILFLNRRGFNTVVYCEDCGAARRCSACDVSLTHHKPASTLVCHYCGRVEPLESACRECNGLAMQPFGVGTQRVAEAVALEVPDARVLRLDRDVTAHAGELDRTLAAFRAREAEILVGTQMVAKGHDFPGVTLVGIILADASLAFPDFRAAERTFQLVTQVAGRAGRADNPGHVIVQTFQPQHYALTCAARHDTLGFFRLEAESRRGENYPPFARMGLIRFESPDHTRITRATEAARRAAERTLREPDLRWRGPVSAPIGKIRDRHREMMMILAPTPARLVAAMRRMRAELEEAAKRVDIVYDVDPIDLL